MPVGVFAQWVPVSGSMQGDLFRIILNTYRRTFPNSTFWYVYGSDQAFFLTLPKPFALDAKRLQQQLNQLPQKPLVFNDTGIIHDVRRGRH